MESKNYSLWFDKDDSIDKSKLNSLEEKVRESLNSRNTNLDNIVYPSIFDGLVISSQKFNRIKGRAYKNFLDKFGDKKESSSPFSIDITNKDELIIEDIYTLSGKPKFRPRKDNPIEHLKKNYKLKCFGSNYDEINQAELRKDDPLLLKSVENWVYRENLRRKEQGLKTFIFSNIIPSSKGKKKPPIVRIPSNHLPDFKSPEEYLKSIETNYPQDKPIVCDALLYLAMKYPREAIEKYGDIYLSDVYNGVNQKLYNAISNQYRKKGADRKQDAINKVFSGYWDWRLTTIQ